eukprot:1156246-Pelagomonas_calceolata.AAC.5
MPGAQGPTNVAMPQQPLHWGDVRRPCLAVVRDALVQSSGVFLAVVLSSVMCLAVVCDALVQSSAPPTIMAGSPGYTNRFGLTQYDGQCVVVCNSVGKANRHKGPANVKDKGAWPIVANTWLKESASSLFQVSNSYVYSKMRTMPPSKQNAGNQEDPYVKLDHATCNIFASNVEAIPSRKCLKGVAHLRPFQGFQADSGCECCTR